MKIQLEQIGKKFNTEWIFRNVSFSFEENSTSAILAGTAPENQLYSRLLR